MAEMTQEQIDNFTTTVGKTFIWHELYSPSTEKAKEFYTKVLGWETETMSMGEAGDYTMFKVNGTSVAGIMATDNEMMKDVPPHWSVYIRVDDVDATMAKATEAGGTVLHGPMDVPTVGRMVLIKDPQNATIWFFTPIG
jgi:hypothetical protein